MIKDKEAIERLTQSIDGETTSPSKREFAEACRNAFEKRFTKDEAEALADFIECNLIKDIRDDVGIDNIQWLVSIIHVYEKAKAIAEDNE